MQIKWQSQLGQDEFVSRATKGKRDGTYVDIGAGHPVQISNTYALEKHFGWRGLLVEKDPDLRALTMQMRAGNIVHDDATTAAWASLFDPIVQDGWIDYLSLDLEPPELTMQVLRQLPLDRFKFRVATIEHDQYRPGGHRRMCEMATIMYSHGYIYFATASIEQEKSEPYKIEDWWIHSQSGLEIIR